MFRATRVPVVALFVNLKDGVSVNEFVELFAVPENDVELIVTFTEALPNVIVELFAITPFDVALIVEIISSFVPLPEVRITFPENVSTPEKVNDPVVLTVLVGA